MKITPIGSAVDRRYYYFPRRLSFSLHLDPILYPVSSRGLFHKGNPFSPRHPR